VTESEWLSGADPEPILAELLRGRASERKLRLLACACCRAWDPDLSLSDFARTAVLTTERYVDGQASREEREAASVVAREAYYLTVQQQGRGARAAWLARLAGWGSGSRDGHLARLTVMNDPDVWRRMGVPRQALLPLVRCIFGNPFLAVAVDPSWLAWGGGTVPAVAAAIYEERAFDRTPILADALEDAGCDNAGILDHLRRLGPHARGCWVIDLLLGKE